MKSVGNTTLDENTTNETKEIEVGRQYKNGSVGRGTRHRSTAS
jgi:hypothetical protein